MSDGVIIRGNAMQARQFIPQYLKTKRCWVLWRLEERNGRNTKVPYTTAGEHASSTDPATWSDYGTAAAVLEKHPGEYSGVGIVFSDALGIVFTDVDHCLDDKGIPDERGREVLDALYDHSYCEVSQSGTGLHFLTMGKFPGIVKDPSSKGGFNNRTANVEMYARGRFCAMTGNAVHVTEPEEDPEGLMSVWSKYHTDSAPQQKNAPAAAIPSDKDGDRLKFAKRHRNFEKLYSGEWQGLYSSQSEADLALCNSLAYWFDRDPQAIDRNFRASGLYREKWEREDYMTTTIQKAVARVGTTFTEWKAQQDRIRQEQNEKLKNDPVLVKIRELDPITNEKYSGGDDISFGCLFADVFGDVAKYFTNSQKREWLCYDGKAWRLDSGGVKVEGFAQKLAKLLSHYVIDKIGDSPTEKETRFGEAVQRLHSRSARERMIADARSRSYISGEALDKDTDLFNVENGTLNLATGEFRPHDPKDYLSKVANVVYDPAAESVEWETFLKEIMLGDAEKVEFLQRIIGYALCGATYEEVAFLLYGSTTRNGKSTFLESVAAVMGDYSSAIAPESLAQKDKSGSAASPDIARLRGVRLLRCAEPPKRMLLDAALLKTLLGRDTITARELYQSNIDFIPQFVLFFNTNFLPVIGDDSVFASGRLQVISFDRHFEPQEQDKGLKNRLTSKDNRSGILNWMLEGLRAYREQGLNPPRSVIDATAQYRQDSDKIQQFVDDILVPTPGENTPGSDAYDIYTEWCQKNGYGVDGKKNFFQDLRAKKLLANTGTVNGKTVRNVIVGYLPTAEAKNTPWG